MYVILAKFLNHHPGVDVVDVEGFCSPECDGRYARIEVHKSLSNMGVSENRGTPKSSILIRFSIIKNPFWGTPIFGNIHIYLAHFGGVTVVPVSITSWHPKKKTSKWMFQLDYSKS